MQYKDYQSSRNLTWDILLSQGVCELPIKVSRICTNLGIKLVPYKSADDNDGYSTIIREQAVIFYNTVNQISRQRFTVAHELGHILLGHVGRYKLVNREVLSLCNPIEQAANVFASRLLAPACVLWGCNVKNAEEIMFFCNISRQAAEYRVERMKILYRRNKFLSSKKEQKLYNQFKPYIEQHKL